jgi:cell wall-associated NlpC family hydrolase
MNICFKKAPSNFSKALIFLVFLSTSISGCRSGKGSRTEERPVKKSALSALEKKLGVELPAESNRAYYEEIASWLGAPYKYGGTDISGIDCSGFVMIVYQRVFGIKLIHQSSQQKEKSKPVDADELKEGDLYFFKLDGKKISHVGMHVAPDYFIHASTKRGVVVSRLSEPYYTKAFSGFGSYR